MTNDEKATVRTILEESQLTILAMVRPLILFKFGLEESLRSDPGNAAALAQLYLVETGIQAARSSVGDSVVEVDIATVRADYHTERPTLRTIAKAA